jgi:type II secretory pathway component PulF
MPLYRFKALLSDGSIVEDEGIYENPEQLFNELKAEGAFLLEYTEKRRLLPKFFSRRIKRKEIAELLHQLSITLKSGIPLISALEDLEPEIKNKALKEVVRNISQSLRRGATVREAFERTGVFSGIVLSLIQIGEESGTLDRTFEEASQHLYRIEEIISQTKRALIYPSFVLLAMTGAFSFWIFYVLPQILKVFHEMNIKLPAPTILLMTIVNFFLRIKFILPFIFIGAIFLFVFLYRHPKTQAPMERFLLKTPILGRVKRLSFLAFFFEHFSLLLSAGLDLRRILYLLKSAFPNRYYQRIVLSMEEGITRGETITDTLKKHEVFRPIDIRMVAVGERTGRLDTQMKMLSAFYYDEVKNLMDQLTKMLEPVILTISGIIFLLIIIALIGPVYELISQIGKGY